ncbi:hypothetical protein, partial [Petrimonas mucosa]|uniref:hypothetical protein n=1 Tax=Petrimonas mucosa TaxID=1642646 RepID=UPI0023F28CFD
LPRQWARLAGDLKEFSCFDRVAFKVRKTGWGGYFFNEKWPAFLLNPAKTGTFGKNYCYDEYPQSTQATYFTM